MERDGNERYWKGFEGTLSRQGGGLYQQDCSCCDHCRRQHADILEWLLYLNLHSHILYHRMHGDSSTFQIAFMLAGKGQMFNQVMLRPPVARQALACR